MRSTAGLVLLGMTVPCFADEMAFIIDMPTVISATRIPQPLLGSPFETTIIERDEILASGYTDVADLLRLVPGFQVAKRSGNSYIVTYHGQELGLSARMEVMIDGRSVYGNLLSAVDWNGLGIDVDDIERIEVVRGPSASLYGTNAFSATINITTIPPHGKEEKEASVVVGGGDNRRIRLGKYGAWGNLDYKVVAGAYQSEGFDHERNDADDFRLGYLSLSGQTLTASGLDVAVDLGMTGGEPGSSFPLELPYDTTGESRLRSDFQSLRVTKKDGTKTEYTFQTYRYHIDQKDLQISTISEIGDIPSFLVPLVFQGIPDQKAIAGYVDGLSERYDADLLAVVYHGGGNRDTYGLGARLDTLESKYHLKDGGPVSNLSYRLSANLERSITGNLSAHAGTMLEHNELVGWFGSARTAMNYRISPIQAIRASISYAERTPSLVEEHWLYRPYLESGIPVDPISISPGNIEAERLQSLRIGYALLLPDPFLSFDISLYREEGSNLISSTKDPGQKGALVGIIPNIVGNLNEYDLSGIEGELKWRPSARAYMKLFFSFNDSNRVNIESTVLSPVVLDNMTSKQMGGVVLSYQFNSGWSVSATHTRMSSTAWRVDREGLPGYGRTDLRIGRRFRLGRTRLDLDVVGQGVGGSYLEYSRWNRFEPRYFAKIRARF